MSRFKRYMVVRPYSHTATYYRVRWVARFIAWLTGGKFQDTNDQVTL